MIINNPTFNPTEPRDGVFLTKTERPVPQIDHNKNIIEEALALYLSLLDYASENDWQHLHLLAAVKPIPAELAKLDQHWYKTAILKPMRDTLLRTKIVRTAAGTLAPIHSPDGESNIWFPSGCHRRRSGVPFGAAARRGFPNSCQLNRTSKSGMRSSGRSATD